MRILTIIAVLLGSTSVWARCPQDLTGTFNKYRAGAENPDNYGISQTELYCEQCRNINAFPLDTRNYLWNRLLHIHDNSNVRQAYLAMFGADYQNPAELTVPICNTYGQCSTNSLRIHFNRLRTNLPAPRNYRNNGVDHIEMIVRTPDGTARRESYDPAMMYRTVLRVPSDTRTDGSPKECLNNLDQHMEEVSDFTNGGFIGGADDPEWVDPYEHWRDEEEAYGGRTGMIVSYYCDWTSSTENTWQCEIEW